MKSALHFCALFLILATGAFAAKPAGKTLPADKPKFPGEIVAVDAKSITIYQSATKEKKYEITEGAKITLDYKPAKLDDLKPGMKAQVSHHPGSDTVASVSAMTVKSGKGKGK